MSLQKPATRRHFTEAARVAAVEARKRKREQRGRIDVSEVFVIRRADAQHQFGWEIRRFGGIVLHRSTDGFATQRAARAAGLQALSAPSVKP